MRTIKARFFSFLLAVMLAITAFSIPVFAESIPTTGGIELETPEADSVSSLEDTEGGETSQIGTVTTGGSNLNVRTGAGTENPAIAKLPNGAQVEVIGREGDWYKVRLVEREGYVCGDYLTIGENPDGDNSLSYTLTEEETAALHELLGGLVQLPSRNALLGHKAKIVQNLRCYGASPAHHPQVSLRFYRYHSLSIPIVCKEQRVPSLPTLSD